MVRKTTKDLVSGIVKTFLGMKMQILSEVLLRTLEDIGSGTAAQVAKAMGVNTITRVQSRMNYLYRNGKVDVIGYQINGVGRSATVYRWIPNVNSGEIVKFALKNRTLLEKAWSEK